MRFSKFSFFLVSVLTILFCSCRKDDGPWWDASFSGPIARTSLNIQNVFPDSMLINNPDSSLRLVFDETIFDLKIDSLFSIPDTTLDTMYVSPLGGYSFQPGDQIFVSPAGENYLNINGVQLKQLILKSGKIKMELISSITEPIVFKYDILNSVFNGLNFSIVEEVPANGSVLKYYDLSGLDINLTGINGNKFNSIITQNTINISNNANAGVINFGQGLIIKITFMDILPFYAKGYFEKQTVNIGPESVQTGFLNGVKADLFSLEDAVVNMSIINGFGVDIQANNVFIQSSNSGNGNNLTLAGSGVNTSYNLNRASFQTLSPQPVVPTIKNYLINSTNSNIKACIENLPDKFNYSSDITINPLGNVSGNNDFVIYGQGLKTKLNIEIPFSFAASNLRFRDTAEIEFSGDELKNINSATLSLRVSNGYPFDASIQGIMCDENFNVLDSLFTGPALINSGSINSNFQVNNNVLSIIPCTLSDTRLENLSKTKKIIFTVKVNTASSPQVLKIYNHYKMDIVLTGDVNYSVNKK